MRTILICSNPVAGHVAPMLRVARHLVGRGDRVIVLTGSRFRDAVTATGARFQRLSGLADYDERDAASCLPDRDRYRGIARAQYEIRMRFVRTIPDQHRSVRSVLARERPDAILVDGAFGGVLPLLFAEGRRPPVVALGVGPLNQSSRDVAPAGTALPPSSGRLGRLRNRLLAAVAERAFFRDTQRLGQRVLGELGVSRIDRLVPDASRAHDRFLQLCAPEFEYPRSDLAANTRFVGPVPPARRHAPIPAWWHDLAGSRPVVHVSQATFGDRDPGRLIRPTLRGLADLDVLVVVSLGGRPVEALRDLPANARVASHLADDRLPPPTSVFVTNGGYGGVQHALREGVPIVAAGGGQDEREVAARVAWSGVGVDLRSGAPSPAAVRVAVEEVLAKPSYRGSARRMAASIARLDTLDLIDGELDGVLARRDRGHEAEAAGRRSVGDPAAD